MKVTVDETKLKFIGLPIGWLDTIWESFRTWVRRILIVTPLNPPYNYYRPKLLVTRVSYKELGKSITFNEELNQSINAQKQRIKSYSFQANCIYYFFAVAFLGVLFFGILPLGDQNLTFAVISSLFFPFLEFFVTALSLRISNILVNKHFADTLAALAGIYLILTLQQDNPISDPIYKRHILEMLRRLRRNIVLLSVSFTSSSSDADPLVYAHFKNMENFIRERERRVIAPKEGTKQDLLNDLYPFVEILITGEYGKLEQKTTDAVVQSETPKPPKTLWEILIRFLLSIFPFLLLVVLYLAPDKITALGLDTNTVFLVSLAWIFLVIDASLKLGIVERAAGLAKTMKEVSKL